MYTETFWRQLMCTSVQTAGRSSSSFGNERSTLNVDERSNSSRSSSSLYPNAPTQCGRPFNKQTVRHHPSDLNARQCLWTSVQQTTVRPEAPQVQTRAALQTTRRTFKSFPTFVHSVTNVRPLHPQRSFTPSPPLGHPWPLHRSSTFLLARSTLGLDVLARTLDVRTRRSRSRDRRSCSHARQSVCASAQQPTFSLDVPARTLDVRPRRSCSHARQSVCASAQLPTFDLDVQGVERSTIPVDERPSIQPFVLTLGLSTSTARLSTARPINVRPPVWVVEIRLPPLCFNRDVSSRIALTVIFSNSHRCGLPEFASSIVLQSRRQVDNRYCSSIAPPQASLGLISLAIYRLPLSTLHSRVNIMAWGHRLTYSFA
ncbi:hypothetical protein LR48_Vigan273s000100 [Vigna angularis]|uniref:Uncharacterized protein n=1 Tax=Phaseolus angularis TaxID=3914 RepID=A0A0L9T7D7_PHAAN|nr:hypothetical protein LR48_Vigan273s000100 [Vigna angularis]